ncbi:hypothetical protein BsWGS_02963 [Bradybaena similaris]
MQSGHQYVQRSRSNARSRSPSPIPRRHAEHEQAEVIEREPRSVFLTAVVHINDNSDDFNRTTDQINHSSSTESRSRKSSAAAVSEDSVHTRLLQQNKMDDMANVLRNYGSLTSSPCTDNNQENGGSVGGVTDGSDTQENNSSSQTSQPKPAQTKKTKSYYTPSMVDELRKRNRLYFLDPITKLRNFHGFPWKLSLQVVKLVIITAQIVIFGAQRMNTLEYFERSDVTYRHLLLKDWSIAYETLPYPPAAGPYAVYNLSELFDHMNAVMERYYKIPDWSLASIHHNKDNRTGKPYPIELCFRANDFIEYPNGSYIISATVLHNCTYIHPMGHGDNKTYDVQTYLDRHNFTLPFNKTLDITLSFYLRTFHLNLAETHYGPTCYNVSINIVYTNIERSGQLLIDLNSEPAEIECAGKIMSEEAESQQESMTAKVITFDAFVMIVCCFSTILCSRSLKRCNNLRQDTAKFFRLHKGKPFSFSSHIEYINMWYIIIICNDILTVTGSAFKIELETRVFSISSQNYEICSILLGLGVFLTYIGILRYLGFFKSYNILILTLKTSFPHVLRFLVCALCLFTGFMLCGWIVFSPYHIKFRGLSTSTECLFSLVNGDDMFVTFSALSESSSDAVWYLHRAYLYTFISLFMYVVISVFIAVIMENYDNLMHYYSEGFPDTEVQKFIKEDGGMSLSEVFRHVNRDKKWQSWFFCLFPCFSIFRRDLKMSSLERDKRELLATI